MQRCDGCTCIFAFFHDGSGDGLRNVLTKRRVYSVGMLETLFFHSSIFMHMYTYCIGNFKVIEQKFECMFCVSKYAITILVSEIIIYKYISYYVLLNSFQDYLLKFIILLSVLLITINPNLYRYLKNF